MGFKEKSFALNVVKYAPLGNIDFMFQPTTSHYPRLLAGRDTF